jgi:hypothetical protein
VVRRPETENIVESNDEEMSVEEDFVDVPKKEIEIRKDFPETWLFENLEFSK